MPARVPHLLMVSQKVVDIKTPAVADQIAQQVGSLRAYLHNFHFIPSNKVTGEFVITEITSEGAVRAKLSGSSLGSGVFPGVEPAIELTLELGLLNYHGSHEVQEVFAAVPDATVDDGGNVQNMFVNVLLLAEALAIEHPQFGPDNFKVTIVSSTDALLRINGNVAGPLRSRFRSFDLNIPDRNAIHLPYNWEGTEGTLSLTSEPVRTSSAVLKLFQSDRLFQKEFRSATCFVSSDPIFDILGNASPPYAYIVNASTSFRAETALRAYSSGTLLPMNESEASEVCRLMLSRGRGTELHQTEAPAFPSPFAISGCGIDQASLVTLDSSLDLQLRYNPIFKQFEGFAFACPISFGQDGGLIIGTNARNIACFTSVPSPEGEHRLFSDYGFPQTKGIHETGAGDGVAAVVALFNSVSPEPVVERFLKGAERGHKDLRLLACTVFVGAISRVIGNLLVRTTRTNLSLCDREALVRAIADVAEGSVETARQTVKLLPRPTFAKIQPLGIDAVLWEPRQVAFPGGIPATI